MDLFTLTDFFFPVNSFSCLSNRKFLWKNGHYKFYNVECFLFLFIIIVAVILLFLGKSISRLLSYLWIILILVRLDFKLFFFFFSSKHRTSLVPLVSCECSEVSTECPVYSIQSLHIGWLLET